MTDDRGHLILFLHAHLPFVRHPEHEEFLEEDWLYEAITETYLPLLAMLEGWVKDGVPGRITMSLTPPLCEMLRDDLLTRRYSQRIQRLVDLAEREVKRTAGDERFHGIAVMYRDRLADAAQRFDWTYDRDLVGAFGRMQKAGVLEIVTCSATHAFLPLLGIDPAFSRAQIKLGVQSYRQHFGLNPPGIWLPECGYKPGLDQQLADEGLCYFIIDNHGAALATPKPTYGTLSPLVCPSGVLAFPRDHESSRQVWSADEGYPGDGRYREFYRDIGYDLEAEHLQGFMQPTGDRKNVGIKYHRITGRGTALHEKQPYDRRAALEAADLHAGNFVFNRAKQFEHYAATLARPPVIVAPYDAELFGHWWYEGPEFLDLVVRKAAYDQQIFNLSTPSDVIGCGLEFQAAVPSASSWGDKGYGEVWCNEKNDWMWIHIHEASDRMASLASNYPHATGLNRRALNQMARELVLASASDWPFIVTMGTMVPYAERRVREHINRFNWLFEALQSDKVNDGWLTALENKDNIFRYIDYRDFAR